jgi:hypothetical protein
VQCRRSGSPQRRSTCLIEPDPHGLIRAPLMARQRIAGRRLPVIVSTPPRITIDARRGYDSLRGGPGEETSTSSSGPEELGDVRVRWRSPGAARRATCRHWISLLTLCGGPRSLAHAPCPGRLPPLPPPMQGSRTARLALRATIGRARPTQDPSTSWRTRLGLRSTPAGGVCARVRMSRSKQAPMSSGRSEG